MNRNEKIKKITAETGSSWLEEAEKKLANKGARKNARKVALEVLRLLREQGITQVDLAERMGVTRQQVGKIVKGQENFTFETIDKLEMALGVTLMTIGTPSEMVYHAPGLAMGMSMAYSGHLTYTLPMTAHPAMGIVDPIDFYITKVANRRHAPFVREGDLIHLLQYWTLKSEPIQETTSWCSLEVQLAVSDSELEENCMS